MSARMLKRALREKQPVDLVEEESEGEEEESPATGNIFSFLLQGDEEKDEEEEEQEDSKPSTSFSSVKNVPNRGKSGKKKKKKGGRVKNPKSPPPEEQREDDEEVAELIEKMARTSTSEKLKEKKAAPADKVAAIISVDPKRLRAEDELRHIFGSKVINSVERSRTRNVRGNNRHQHLLQRSRKLLVAPMAHWPRWEGGFSMELKETTKDGVMHFSYVYTPAYMSTQTEFKHCVDLHDPNVIVLLLASHPYHADALLSLAEALKHTGEHQQAAELVERCLYALESAWHPLFNPTGGKCRLDFSREENKSLFMALFRHMQHLGRRGCHRTALEVCKLLLSLDVDDPLGVRFCVDYYALRAEQYSWLESFVADFYEDASVALLPNFSFSLAVARLYLEQKEEVRGDVVPSSDLLQQALMLHPLVLGKVVARAPVKEDAEWKALLKHPLFSKATAGGPSLDHLINIYIERNYLIWRIPQLQVWLKTAATSVISKQDGGAEAASWACARTEAFQADHNEYQHLSQSEFSDSTPTLPPDEPQPHGNIGGAGVEEYEQVPGDRNPLLVFIESLLPWNNYGNLNHGMEEGNEEWEQEQEQEQEQFEE